MAMVITKFHRLIGSKTFWIIFSFLVVVSFSLTMIPNFDPSRDLQFARSAGTLNGTKISPADYDAASFFAGQSRLSSIAPADRDTSNDTWIYLATLQKAEAMGIHTSMDEVRQDIQRAVPGSTLEERQRNYFGFLNEQWNGSETLFLEFQRRERTIDKLAGLIASTPSLSPSDEIEGLADMRRTFTVDYAVKTATISTNEWEVSDDQLVAYYEQSKENYRLPDQVKVKYIALRVRDYIDTNTVAEASAKAFYESNLTRFTQNISVTNETTGVVSNDVRIKPYEEAAVEILNTLARNDGVTKARREADQFYAAMLPRRNHVAQSFEDLAAQFGNMFPAYTSNWFTVSQLIPGITIGTEFNRAAFLLGTNGAERISTPLVGSSGVYLMVLDGKKSAHVPPLDEIKDAVLKDAMEHYRREAALNEGKEVAKQWKDAIKEGSTLASLAESTGWIATNLPPFSMVGREYASVGEPFVFDLVGLVQEAAPKQLLEPVLSVDNKLVIGYVRSIDIPEAPSSDDPDRLRLRSELQGAARDARLRALYQHLIKTSVIKSNRPSASMDDNL